jgi:hypothetical protein
MPPLKPRSFGSRLPEIAQHFPPAPVTGVSAFTLSLPIKSLE